MRDTDGVITLRHKHYRSVICRHRLIETPVIIVDTMHNIALRGVHTVVICFLQIGLMRQIISVMFMRRIGGPIAGWCDHLNYQQTIGRLSLRQDIADMSGVCTAAPGFQRHGIWRYMARRMNTIYSRCTADGNLRSRCRLHLPVSLHRHIESMRGHPVKD